MPTNQTLVKLAKAEINNLRWVTKALMKYNDTLYDELRGMQVIGQRIICADGFRAFSIPKPANIHKQNTIVYPITPIGKYMGLEDRGNHVPNNLKLLHVDAADQIFAFRVNGKYLAEALAMCEPCVIRIYRAKDPSGQDAAIAVVVPTDETDTRLAMLMLMRGETEPKSYHLVPVDDNIPGSI